MYKKIALISLIIILVLVNWSIYQKELHIKNGAVVYLKLAPVDPRSLMQGDYMALRFDIARNIRMELLKKDIQDGRILVSLNEKKVASFSSIFVGQMFKKNEILLRYRIRNGAVKFATNAFFFEEGSAKKYEKAKYGEFRVNPEGELLLVDLVDENLSVI